MDGTPTERAVQVEEEFVLVAVFLGEADERLCGANENRGGRTVTIGDHRHASLLEDGATGQQGVMDTVINDI